MPAGRISGIVDVPNACATLAIPLAIFDQVPRLILTGCRASLHMQSPAQTHSSPASHVDIRQLCHTLPLVPQDIRPKRDGIGPPTGPRVVDSGSIVKLPQCAYEGSLPTFKNACQH